MKSGRKPESAPHDRDLVVGDLPIHEEDHQESSRNISLQNSRKRPRHVEDNLRLKRKPTVPHTVPDDDTDELNGIDDELFTVVLEDISSRIDKSDNCSQRREKFKEWLAEELGNTQSSNCEKMKFCERKMLSDRLKFFFAIDILKECKDKLMSKNPIRVDSLQGLTTSHNKKSEVMAMDLEGTAVSDGEEKLEGESRSENTLSGTGVPLDRANRGKSQSDLGQNKSNNHSHGRQSRSGRLNSSRLPKNKELEIMESNQLLPIPECAKDADVASVNEDDWQNEVEKGEEGLGSVQKETEKSLPFKVKSLRTPKEDTIEISDEPEMDQILERKRTSSNSDSIDTGFHDSEPPFWDLQRIIEPENFQAQRENRQVFAVLKCKHFGPVRNSVLQVNEPWKHALVIVGAFETRDEAENAKDELIHSMSKTADSVIDCIKGEETFSENGQLVDFIVMPMRLFSSSEASTVT